MNRIAKDVSSANGTVLRGQYGCGSVIDRSAKLATSTQTLF